VGIRKTQNWIGGSSYHPLDAEFVPPPPELVPGLMADLVAYLDGAVHGPLVQAALVHAQFETIHPFGDGNGRVGRALIHAVLRRRGLVPAPVLPVSMVLHTKSDRYVRGLQAFRTDPGDERAAMEGIVRWIEVFTDAADSAVDQAERVASEITQLRAEWTRTMSTHREASGLRGAVRADSVAARLLNDLPASPVLTAGIVADTYRTSQVAARRALDELAEAGVLRKRSVGPRVTGYFAHDVLDIVGAAERRLASTRFDTRAAPPTGFPVPGS